MARTFKLSIKGRVTGVCFRMETVRFAAHFPSLRGFVRNVTHNNVEVVMQGDENSIVQMSSWLKIGPPMAQVDSVETEIYDEREIYEPFTIKD